MFARFVRPLKQWSLAIEDACGQVDPARFNRQITGPITYSPRLWPTRWGGRVDRISTRGRYEIRGKRASRFLRKTSARRFATRPHLQASWGQSRDGCGSFAGRGMGWPPDYLVPAAGAGFHCLFLSGLFSR